ncbi:unnamed protein product [Phytomonas sp. Hart1]|nr:unnamed protein product [Phytomonas sp. Hart1]|eukprot:CCW66572.1 unnamed protein product [Phytomonas sp. isolate Hart1]
MSLWPFRTGNDARFQTTPDAPEESIYDTIRGDLPPDPFGAELDRYLQWRWRRGILPSVVPTAAYGAILGFLVGFRQSRVEGRYVGRARVMGRYTTAFAAVGLLTAASHHAMVMRNDYRDTPYYPILSATSGSVLMMTGSQMGSIGQGVFAGVLLGMLYAAGCYAMRYYHRRRMTIFLSEQQLQQIPVCKLSPELQPMYRSYLFDNRPIEESSKARREALLLSRSEDDTRLDAYTFMQHMSPEIYDWVNFPDWWPLKWSPQSEEDEMLNERRRLEEAARLTRKALETDEGALLKRKFRAKKYRDV